MHVILELFYLSRHGCAIYMVHHSLNMARQWGGVRRSRADPGAGAGELGPQNHVIIQRYKLLKFNGSEVLATRPVFC